MAGNYINSYTNGNHTIWWALDQMSHNKMVLPLIQRKFTWEANQIYDFLDSILRGFPIGSMLFSSISSNNNLYYPFTTSVKQNDTEQDAQGLNDIDDVVAVLDGQQRLYSLIVCFANSSTFEYKDKYDQEDKTYSLYINVSSKVINSEEADTVSRLYDIRFNLGSEDYFFENESLFIKPSVVLNFVEKEITDNWDLQADENDSHKEEIKLNKTIEMLDINLIKNAFEKYLEAQITNLKGKYDNLSNHNTSKKKKLGLLIDQLTHLKDKIPSHVLETMLLISQKVMVDNSIINCTTISNQKADTQTEVFVRLNSGGTKLSFSDLLLSKLTSYFELHNTFSSTDKNKNDARKIIWNNILKKINSYSLYPDEKNILKCILILLSSDSKCGKPKKGLDELYSATSISFKYVDKINEGNLQTISVNWNTWSSCICFTYKLIHEDLGLTSKTLKTYYAVIPIVLLLYLCGVYSEKKDLYVLNPMSKKIIKWFLTSASLNQVFSSSVDTKLSKICKSIHESCSSNKDVNNAILDFYKKIRDINNDAELYGWFNISEDNITNWLNYLKKKDWQTLILLSLLYPKEANQPDLNIDHMHPHSGNEKVDNIDSIMNLKIFHGSGRKKDYSTGNIAISNEALTFKSLKVKEYRNEDGKYASGTLLLSADCIDDLNRALLKLDIKNCKNDDDLKKESNKLSETLLDFKKYDEFINKRREYINACLINILIDPQKNMPIIGN